MVAVENIIVAAVMVLSFTLMVIAFLAWRRTHDIPMVFLGAAFAIFFVKALVLSVALFYQVLALSTLIALSGTFDLVILALFYAFTLRR